MGKLIRYLAFVIVASIFLVGSIAFAQGKGKGQGNKPRGWEKGEKKGWQSDASPPGIEKKGGWTPPGLGEKEEGKGELGASPGWSRGEKKGWKGAETPPGLAEEKEKGKKKKKEAKGKKKRKKVKGKK